VRANDSDRGPIERTKTLGEAAQGAVCAHESTWLEAAVAQPARQLHLVLHPLDRVQSACPTPRQQQAKTVGAQIDGRKLIVQTGTSTELNPGGTHLRDNS
jgi:hypothetical protein